MAAFCNRSPIHITQRSANSNGVNFNHNVQGRNIFFASIQDAIYNAKSFKDLATGAIAGRGNNYVLGNGAANFPMAAAREIAVQHRSERPARRSTEAWS